MTPAVDTHCHLVLLQERGLLQRALEGAAEAGISHLVTIGVSLDDSERNREIADQHEGVWFAVGWDPQQPHAPDAAELRALEALLAHPKAVAVGEVGLDYNFRPGYHETPADVQQVSFRTMLELAASQAKPVVVHDRDAHADVLQAIAAVPGSRGVMHCFTGDAEHAQRCREAGFALSFSGIVTFRNAHDLQDAARRAPLGTFVVETDAPFLTPVPHRGETNLPERVRDTLAHLAALRAEHLDPLTHATTVAALHCFGLHAA